MREADFDPGLSVRDVIESLGRTLVADRRDLVETLFRQVAESKSNVDRLQYRWGSLSEVAQNKMACDIGYKAWVLLETGVGDDDLGTLSFG